MQFSIHPAVPFCYCHSCLPVQEVELADVWVSEAARLLQEVTMLAVRLFTKQVLEEAKMVLMRVAQTVCLPWYSSSPGSLQ